MPCHPARARTLLRKGRARVLRKYPFTIILLDREGGYTQATQIKIDPGSKRSGIAIVGDFKRGLRCIWAAELTHRGHQIRDNLLRRRQLRRSRRSRKTRYRQPRFANRTRPRGWLPPSLQSRVDNLATWLNRLVNGQTHSDSYDAPPHLTPPEPPVLLPLSTWRGDSERSEQG